MKLMRQRRVSHTSPGDAGNPFHRVKENLRFPFLSAEDLRSPSATNHSPLKALPLPLSSRPKRTRISCHAALDKAACAPFREEGRNGICSSGCPQSNRPQSNLRRGMDEKLAANVTARSLGECAKLWLSMLRVSLWFPPGADELWIVSPVVLPGRSSALGRAFLQRDGLKAATFLCHGNAYEVIGITGDVPSFPTDLYGGGAASDSCPYCDRNTPHLRRCFGSLDVVSSRILRILQLPSNALEPFHRIKVQVLA